MDLEYRDDPGLTHAVARAFNRAMVDFCSVDRRLPATCYVPLALTAPMRSRAMRSS
jgi:hypothetical protein